MQTKIISRVDGDSKICNLTNIKFQTNIKIIALLIQLIS